VSELIKCLRGEEFPERAQIFQTMSNSFKLGYIQNLFLGGQNHFLRPYLRACSFIFILFNGKRREARAWSAICRSQLRQYDSKKSTYRGEKWYINKSI